MEMQCRPLEDKTVQSPGAQIAITQRADETVWTENSHKYTTEEVVGMARETGYECVAQWVDEEWPFAQSLLIAR